MAETKVIRVRYWAAAKAAAGTDVDDVPVNGPTTLAEPVSYTHLTLPTILLV